MAGKDAVETLFHEHLNTSCQTEEKVLWRSAAIGFVKDLGVETITPIPVAAWHRLVVVANFQRLLVGGA